MASPRPEGTAVSQSMPSRHRSFTLPGFLAVALLALCGFAGQAPAVAGDDTAASAGGPYTRVLIVGVTPDDNVRCRFELFLAEQIQNDTTVGIPSCDVVTPLKPLTQVGIEQAVAAQQADAVLATILVSRKEGEVVGGDRDTRGGDYFKAEGEGFETGYFGVYGVPVVYGEFEDLPPVDTIDGQVHLVTRVYETRGPTLVRTVNSVAKHLESSDQAAAEIAEKIAKQLRREGVVR